MSCHQPKEKVYDLIGIGIGPFNLGLAALSDNVKDLDAIFFEQKPKFEWHTGMLIEGTTLQVPFLADLVSMADATNKFSFLNYLQHHNRLYNFYFLEKFHITRLEYNHYCQWVADQLDTCKFGTKVINLLKSGNHYKVDVLIEGKRRIESYYCKNLVLGVGTKPIIPTFVENKIGNEIFHSSEFLNNKDRILNCNSITIIGSGQSSGEIFYDLLKEQKSYNYSLSWFTRSKGFFPMEYSKLGLEYFSPDYIDYFYKLNQNNKDKTISEQSLLYKGISETTIADIYNLLYERTIANNTPSVYLQAMTEIQNVVPEKNLTELKCYQWHAKKYFSHHSEVVILATGYKPEVPAFIEGLDKMIDWDEYGRYKITKDYKIMQTCNQDTNQNIYIQNAELHTHGVGAPDLGLGAYRNSIIINSISGREIYPVNKKNVFQNFEPTNTLVKL